MTIGKTIYHFDDNNKIQKYRIIRINKNTIFVQNQDRSQEFTVPLEEFNSKWFFDIKELYKNTLKDIDNEIEDLYNPIKERINELKMLKRLLKTQLENV